MNIRISKKRLDNIFLKENNKIISFPKSKIRLINEDNNEKNAYVEPSSDHTSSLASDLSKSKAQNPTDDTFIVNNNSYDGDSSNNTVTLDVDANSTSDAASQVQNLQRNPNVRNLMNRTNVNTKVHIREMEERSVSFTKKELTTGRKARSIGRSSAACAEHYTGGKYGTGKPSGCAGTTTIVRKIALPGGSPRRRSTPPSCGYTTSSGSTGSRSSSR